MSPELSGQGDRAGQVAGGQVAELSFSVTGSPAGAVTVKLTEQFPNGTGQIESRASPAAVNGWAEHRPGEAAAQLAADRDAAGRRPGAEDEFAVAAGHPDLAVADRGAERHRAADLIGVGH